ncbi:MAG TPA: carbon-nitrogen hydrolase family protein [Stellaceae bacterium]|nr:carbon-nitrogen hydrolase family protein [Stellaceae bacterium]
MSRPWRVAAIQLPGCGADPAANRAVAAACLREAAARRADLALLPELATLPFFCGEAPEAWHGFAEPRDGALIAEFSRLCRDLGIALLLPFYERDDGRYHNSIALIGRDGALVPAHGRRGALPVIRKLHLPAPDEVRQFSPGEGLGVFELEDLRLGALICYDRRFPECWRELRALGAELVAVPIAGEGGDSLEFFLGELRTHARENGVAVLSANKIGPEYVGAGVVQNFGESCVVSAEGEIIARRAGAEGPGVLIAEIDAGAIAEQRRRWPYFEQRRLDLFPGPSPVAN